MSRGVVFIFVAASPRCTAHSRCYYYAHNWPARAGLCAVQTDRVLLSAIVHSSGQLTYCLWIEFALSDAVFLRVRWHGCARVRTWLA